MTIRDRLPRIDARESVNYTDSSTFSRVFRSWAGTAPSAWRHANAM